MAIPSYWASGFKKSVSAAFTDVADWIVAIRTMLTATLDVADRWVESPAGTFTSPADPISGNQIVLVLVRTSALRMWTTVSQIVGGVTTAMSIPGEADISGASVMASIMAGPRHFWTEINIAFGEFSGIAMADPSPEAPSGFVFAVIAKAVRAQNTAVLTLNADAWQACPDAQAGDYYRALGPTFIAAAASQEMKTAGGSNVFFPVAATTWPTTTASRFIGNLNQFVWVDPGFAAGDLVSVPIDVGVVGVFQVLNSNVTRACLGRGAKLAVRVA